MQNTAATASTSAARRGRGVSPVHEHDQRQQQQQGEQLRGHERLVRDDESADQHDRR